MPPGPRGRGGDWHHTPCPPGDLNYLYVDARDASTVTSDCSPCRGAVALVSTRESRGSSLPLTLHLDERIQFVLIDSYSGLLLLRRGNQTLL